MSFLLRKHCVQWYIWGGGILLLSDVVFVHFATEFMTGAVCLRIVYNCLQIVYNSVVRDRLCVCVHVCVCVCVHMFGRGLAYFCFVGFVFTSRTNSSVVGVKIHYLNCYHFSHAHMLSSRCS